MKMLPIKIKLSKNNAVLKLKIVENPLYVYLSGEKLVAELIFDGDFTREKSVTGFEVCLKGQALVRKSIVGNVVLGVNIRRIEFILPVSLPASVSHSYGEVKYTLCARMTATRPIQFKPIKCVFFVRNHLDLTRCLANKNQKEASTFKTFCFGPCVSSPIYAELKIEKTGFVSGETIRCQVCVDNFMTKRIKKMTVELIAQASFTFNIFGIRRTKLVQEVLSCCNFLDTAGVNPCSSEIWSNIALIIPSSMRPNMSCRLVAIRYCVLLKIFVDGLSNEMNIKISILIGSEPNRHTSTMKKPKEMRDIEEFSRANMLPTLSEVQTTSTCSSIDEYIIVSDNLN